MKFFFIGICGVSMSGLAYLLQKSGHEVKGSDLNYLDKPECLKEIQVYMQPYLKGVEWADIIVLSSAIKENDEVLLAKNLGKQIFSRGKLLGKISDQYEKVIAVAGSHGKTTTTAMIFHVLSINGKNPTLHLGGNLIGVGNVFLGDKEFFITEACEYCDNFLFLHPYISIITNIEPEHLDYFKSFSNEKKSFRKFEKNSFYVIKKNEHIAKNLRINKKGELSFTVYKADKRLGKINLKIGGKYNARNAVNCLEACQKIGLSFSQIKFGLETFKGVKKRCEKVKSAYPFKVFIDYAHHPKEIEEVGKYFKSICIGKCIAVFQPHTFSRTKKFFTDFIKSLSLFDEIICFKTYPAREIANDGYSEKDLYDGLTANNKIVFHCESEAYLRILLKNYSDKDIVVFIGAGDLPDKFDFNKNLT